MARVASDLEGPQMILSNNALDFRACLGQVNDDEGEHAISNETALALGLRIGDTVRYVAARPG